MKLFGFGSSTPPPPSPPSKPPTLTSNPAPAPAASQPSAPPEPKAVEPAPPAPSITGRWQDAGDSGDGSESTEFHADGSVTESLTGGETIRGRYVFAGDKLTINLAGMDEPLAFTAIVKQDSLQMTDASGQRSTYRRL